MGMSGGSGCSKEFDKERRDVMKLCNRRGAFTAESYDARNKFMKAMDKLGYVGVAEKIFLEDVERESCCQREMGAFQVIVYSDKITQRADVYISKVDFDRRTDNG